MIRAGGLAAALCLAAHAAPAQAPPPGPQTLIEQPYPSGRRDPPVHFVRPHGQRLLPVPYPEALGATALDDPALVSPRARRQRLTPTPYPRLVRPPAAQAPVVAGGPVVLLAQAGAAAPAAPLRRLSEIGPYFARCWSESAGSEDGPVEATVRFALRRDGRLLGPPRITATRGPDAASREIARRAALQAVQRCAPAPLSPGLGAAVAGRVLTLRFRAARGWDA